MLERPASDEGNQMPIGIWEYSLEQVEHHADCGTSSGGEISDNRRCYVIVSLVLMIRADDGAVPSSTGSRMDVR